MKDFLNKHIVDFTAFLAVYSWVLVFTVELGRI